MRRVILESPYRAPTRLGRYLNERYAIKCLHHSLTLGEAPIASHLLYTRALDDKDPAERQWGIDAGLAWGEVAEATVVYMDRGLSQGMQIGIFNAHEAGRPVEYRKIEGPKA
jgi:hypothetical protein